MTLLRMDHREALLRLADSRRPEAAAFESVYSAAGDIAPIGRICDLAAEFAALTDLDEVDAIGPYGLRDAGIAKRDGVIFRVDPHPAVSLPLRCRRQ